MARLRTRTISAGDRGMAFSLAGGLFDTPGSVCVRTEWCSDVVGNYPNPNPLTIVKETNLKWRVSGVCDGWWRTENFAVLWNSIPQYPASKPELSDNVVLSSVLARTNPNTPKVDVPVFLAELAELPRMIMDWGDSIRFAQNVASRFGRRDVRYIPRAAAKRYVEYQFGIEPFFRDLAKMLQLQSLIDKKMRQLEKLGSPTGQHSTATVWEDSATTGPWSDYVSDLYFEHRRVLTMYSTKRRVWGSSVWKPAVPLPVTDADKRALAFRLVFGFGNLSFSEFWEAMPWSWLLDWFGNVGDLLNLHRNEIPVTHGGSCIMRSTETSRSLAGYESINPGDTIAVWIPPWTRSEKTRVVLGDASPNLEFSLPFLDGKQLSILSALLVSKRDLR